MEIAYEIMNEGLIDSRGIRCGRVDDILVEDGFDRPPRILGLVVGSGAKSRLIGRWAYRLSAWLHRLLGVQPPINPVVVPWERVESINSHIVLNASAADLGLNSLDKAVVRRIIGRIPGAGS
jgi:sporulation protein YlmC with PRC-barrel domain